MDGTTHTLPAVPNEGGNGRDWDELRRKLQGAVRRVCPPWLANDQEDLVQVALLRVMDVERKSEGERQFSSSYLVKVAYSALIDEIRRRRRRKETELDENPNDPRMTEESPGPERVAGGNELGRAIQDCLAALIRPRRMAVALHLKGHGVPDAARLLDWPAKRTENLVYRGMKDLRECIAGKGFAP